MRWESQPQRVGLDAERAAPATRRPQTDDGECSAGAGCLAEGEPVGPCRIGPIVDGDDRAAIGLGTDPKWRQLLWGREPVILRLALGRAEEMHRLGRGSADETEHARIA